MSVIVLDAGNSIIKAKISRRENGETAFPHAMKKLTDSIYGTITERAVIQLIFHLVIVDPSVPIGKIDF